MQDLLDLVSGDRLWIALGVGLLFSGLAFFVGWLIFHKREKPDSLTVRARESGMPSAAALKHDFSFGMEMARRKSVRRKGNQIEVVLSTDESHQDCAQGLILDRSLGGLGIAVPAKVKIGVILHVRPADAPEHVPWVQVEVKRCRERDDESWEIGCQYVGQPQAEVLGLFG